MDLPATCLTKPISVEDSHISHFPYRRPTRHAEDNAPRMAIKRKRDSIGSNTSKGIRKTKKEVDEPKVQPLGTTLADLPDNVVTNILLKLSIKSVLICKNVCKSWRSIISDPYFAQLHFEGASITALVRTRYSRHVSRTLHLFHFDEFKSNEAQNLPSDNDCSHVCSCKYSPRPNCDNHIKLEVKFKLPLRDSEMVIDTMLEARRRGKKRTNIASKPRDNKFDVVNSCNGLLCLCSPVKRNRFLITNPTTLVVCNPITGEFIRIPQSENDKPMEYCSIYSGLGYLKKTNEYKVIRISVRTRVPNDGVVEIHTLGTRFWRNIKYDGLFWWKLTPPTCLNGSLHWLVCRYPEVSILCFDLESETLNSFPCPSAVSSMTNTIDQRRIGFGEMKGSLYICYPYTNANCLKFWTMKKYGDGQSWTEIIRFNIEDFNCWPRLCQPIIVSFGPGILICDSSRFFIYCDPQKHLFRFLEGRGTSFGLEPIFHIPSLIRLEDVVKGDNIEVLNVHSRCATFKLREEKEVLYLAKYKADLEDLSMDFQNF